MSEIIQASYLVDDNGQMMELVDQTARDGIELNKTKTGIGEPTERTVGVVGSLYMDTDTSRVYKCVNVEDGVYTWVGITEEWDDGIGHVSGYIAYVNDAEEMAPLRLVAYGKTTQNGTPSVENPVDLVGYTSGGSADGVHIARFGKNLVNVVERKLTSANREISITANVTTGFFPGCTYTVFVNIAKVASKTGRVYINAFDANNQSVNSTSQVAPGEGDLSLTFTVPDTKMRAIYIGLSADVTEGDEATITAQVEIGKVATSFEPYNAKTVWCKLPNTAVGGMHGIPVASGGNYTDAEGQEWVCDTMDWVNKVFTQRCATIASYAGETIPGAYMSSTGELSTGAKVVYELDEPVSYNVNPESAITMLKHNNVLFVKQGAAIELEYQKTVEELPEETIEAQAAFDPRHYGMDILWLEGDTSGINKDNEGSLKWTYKNMEGTCSVKWQGSTSVWFPKKNYTIKFDQEFEVVEGWGAQKKYCFKANYIDHSHARNICCAKLWGQVVKSRAVVPTQFAGLPNAGAIDGIPCAIMLNGKFHGLYTWNIPKDGWMMGMSEGDREAILCAEGTTDAKGFKQTIDALDTEYSYEYSKDKDDTDWIIESLNRLITACLNSDGTDLDTTIAQYLDWDSAIDSYIFATLISGHDNIVRNYILCTFDGIKWYFSQYDMDETFGQYGSGTNFRTNYAFPTIDSAASLHRVYELIKLYKADKLKARYEELRNGVMSELNVCGTFANFIKHIPPHALMADLELYPTIPSASMSNYAQIAHYYSLRVKEADKDFEKL